MTQEEIRAIIAENEQLRTEVAQLRSQLGAALARIAELGQDLMRHQDELFQYLLVPGLPADNNLAERSLCPLVVLRKISGGSRSDRGTKTRLTLASLFSTWLARNLNPFTQCLMALQHPTPTAPP